MRRRRGRVEERRNEERRKEIEEGRRPLSMEEGGKEEAIQGKAGLDERLCKIEKK